LIGINYIGHAQGQLRGCINDVKNMYNFITIGAGFNPANIRVLTDDQTDPTKQPTKHNIEEGMKWLVEGAQPGDSMFFHYSGHGSQQKDLTFLEDDGMNETICPMDYPTAGQIIDDKIHAWMAKPLPAGARLTAIFDSCHSGTVMDLPYIYKAKEGAYKGAHRADGDTFMNRHKKMGFKGGITGMLMSHVGGEVAHVVKKTARSKINAALNETKADVIQFSGCRDEQTSSDATVGGLATGAMSWALMEALRRDSNVTYEQLIANMRDLLHNGPKQFRQVPQVSYGNPSTDMSQLFTL
jgi:metacaspase-1